MSETSKSSLSALSVDCLDHVLSFDIPNGVINLMLTGCKSFIHKVLQTTRISVVWNKSGFLYWREIIPLLNMLPKLESLSLRTWSPRVLPQGPISPAGLFSTKLRRLHLSYLGCGQLLNYVHSLTFENLVVLEDLSIYDESTVVTPIFLRRLSRSLRSLRIQSSGHLDDDRYMCYYWKDLLDLPADLETLYLHTNSPAEDQQTHLEWPSHLSSVTDLSIRLNNDQYLDITTLAPRLKRLGYSGKGLQIESLGDVFARNVPLKQYFPVLESLVTTLYTLSDMNQFRNLPPTLTELAVSFDLETKPLEQEMELLEALDRDAVDKNGVWQHLCTKNLRLFAPYDAPLTKLRALSHQDSASSLPSLQAAGSISHLELTSEPIDSMVDALPSTLEKLKLATTVSFLEALVARSSMLPKLTDLDLTLPQTSLEPCKLDVSTIPITLTQLVVRPSPTVYTASLLNHHRLTRLSLAHVNLVELVPVLPPNLLTLSASLSLPVNLSNPVDALVLLSMSHQVPYLRELNLLKVFTEESWLQLPSPLNPPQITTSQWFTLPSAVTTLYSRYYITNSPLRRLCSQDSMRTAAELFAISCIPKSVCILKLPDLALFNKPSSPPMLRRAAFVWVKYQLPLLGLPLHDSSIPESFDFIYNRLPPSLSYFAFGTKCLPDIGTIFGRRATGYDRGDFVDPYSRLPSVLTETGFYITNAVTWFLIARFGPSNWKQNSPLRAYMLSTAIGSTIAAPLVLWKLANSGTLLTSFAFKYVEHLLTQSLGAVPFVAPANLLLAFGIGSTQRGPFARGAALTVGLSIAMFVSMGVQGNRG